VEKNCSKNQESSEIYFNLTVHSTAVSNGGQVAGDISRRKKVKANASFTFLIFRSDKRKK
jgi:hypothetical protein